MLTRQYSEGRRSYRGSLVRSRVRLLSTVFMGVLRAGPAAAVPTSTSYGTFPVSSGVSSFTYGCGRVF